MSTREMLARYPFMRQSVAATPRGQLPDYEPKLGEQLFQLSQIAGALARTLLAIIFALAALGVVVFIVVVLVK